MGSPHHQPCASATTGFVFICPGRFEAKRGYPCAAGTGANLARVLLELNARLPDVFSSPSRNSYVITNSWATVEYPALTGRSVPTEPVAPRSQCAECRGGLRRAGARGDACFVGAWRIPCPRCLWSAFEPTLGQYDRRRFGYDDAHSPMVRCRACPTHSPRRRLTSGVIVSGSPRRGARVAKGGRL